MTAKGKKKTINYRSRLKIAGGKESGREEFTSVFS